MAEWENLDFIVISGPTASGKTRVAAKLAQQISSEILSADSRQVYRELTIGSGKDLKEYNVNGSTVPYHLIDICSVKKLYTLYHYQKDFYKTWSNIREKINKPVIVCGGTGLYLKAVLKKYKIANVQENPDFRKECQFKTKVSLEKELFEMDEAIYKNCDCSSKKRIIRSLEIAQAKKQGLLQYSMPPEKDFKYLFFLVNWEKSILQQRVFDRLDQRIQEGLIEEVQGLLNDGVDFNRLLQLGLEYAWVARYLNNEMDLPSLKDGLGQAILKFIKSQNTLFRGMQKQGILIKTVSGENAVNEMIEYLSGFSIESIEKTGKSKDIHGE